MKKFFLAALCAVAAIPVSAGMVSAPPKDVCKWVEGIGLSTHGWKNYYSDEHGCTSPYREIGAGVLANNVAYYVTGKKSTVSEVKLVINIYDRGSAPSAHAELLRAAKILSKKATGVDLTDKLVSAIKKGVTAEEKVGRFLLSVTRDNWPTGKGYEVQFIIK